MDISTRNILLICGALIGSVIFFKSGLFNYKTYEDCILGEMKGQNESLRWIAGEKCARLFHIPQWVSADEFQPEYFRDSVRATASDKYTPYSIKARFIDKPCNELTEDDRRNSQVTTIKFNGSDTAFLPYGVTAQCTVGAEFEGILK